MIAACLKWVDHRSDADVALGAGPDRRFAGVSASDQAALEWALRTRDGRFDDGEVVAVTAGPAEADAILRDAMAAGADRAIRVDLPFGSSSSVVASALADVLGDATTVWCGDYSFDRGTGSVPAFLAAELGIAQALGLVSINLAPSLPSTMEPAPAGDADAAIEVLRRLDGGRRERLTINDRAVLSVEGSTALLRRAPLRGLLATRTIEVVEPPSRPTLSGPHGDLRPYRPRPRTFAAPIGVSALERVKALMSTGSTPTTHGETVTLDPAAAADRILAALAEWGYLP